MAYFKPYIDESGLHIPTYRDILEDLIASMKEIYGSDIYLGNDSADYQLLSVFALKQADTLQAIAQAYNSRSPSTAVGVGLDSVVKLNGIKRKAASKSACTVQLTGTPGAVITHGVVSDSSGTRWDLPAACTIGADGTAECVATCQDEGRIDVSIGDLCTISTPTAGWTSVTNPGPAILGEAKETDADLRRRQTISVALPSVTLLESTRAALLSIGNVCSVAVYENDTNVTTSDGFPPHSVTCIVEGGDEDEIAERIFEHKGIGCYTHGDTVIEYVDSAGCRNDIRFFRPTYKPIYVSVKIRKYTGYVSSVLDDIRAAIKTYIDELGISNNVSVAMLSAVIGNCNPQIHKPIFTLSEIKTGVTAANLTTADVVVGFKEIPVTSLENISVGVLSP